MFVLPLGKEDGMKMERSKKTKTKWVLRAVFASTGFCGIASASPFLDVQIVGSTTFSSTGQGYTATVNATPGQTIYYDVFGVMNQNAVTNSTKPFTLTSGQVDGTDGINSAQFNLADNSSAQLTAPAHVDLNGALGTTGGTATGTAITGIDVAGAAGTFAGGVTPVLLVDGSFTAGTYSSDLISATGNYGGANVGGIKADTTVGQKTIQLNNASEGSPGAPGADPYTTYAPLTVSEASPVPEPASVALFAVGGLATIIRRRRKVC
jgi:hypothetical protein